jgi:hypothetical protein
MSVAAPMLLDIPIPLEPKLECRVYERHACELPTSCRPVSALEMRESPWSATIRDLSQGGLALHLQRRYEKGAALAVELPGEVDREPSVVFVKVVHVKRLAGGEWKLGCQFISELSDEHVHRLVAPDSPVRSRASLRTTRYSHVNVEVGDRGGATFRLTIKQLYLAKGDGVSAGQQLRIAGGPSPEKRWSLLLKVDHLKSDGDQWNLQGLLVQPTTVAELVQSIKRSKQPSSFNSR